MSLCENNVKQVSNLRLDISVNVDALNVSRVPVIEIIKIKSYCILNVSNEENLTQAAEQ